MSLLKRSILAGLIELGYVMTVSICYVFSSFYVAFQSATGFTGTEIGLLITAMGIVSIIVYFPAGWLADRVKTKTLLIVGLTGSAICALGIALLPPFNITLILYIMIGIFSSGAAYIPCWKAIRLLGSDEEQNQLASAKTVISKGVALVVSFLGIWLVSAMATERMGMQVLLLTYTGILFAIVISVAIFFKTTVEDTAAEKPASFKEMLTVLKIKNVWIIGLMGFGIYAVAIALIYVQPYMAQVYGLSTVQSSTLGVLYKQMGILSAPVLGFVLARSKKIKFTSQIITYSFVLLVLCFGFYLLVPASSDILFMAIAVFLIASFFDMGAWAYSMVPITEIKIPVRLSGIAIGLVSMIFYLGDVVLYALFGSWTDIYGLQGYTYIFMFTIVVLIVVFLAGLHIVRETKKIHKSELM